MNLVEDTKIKMNNKTILGDNKILQATIQVNLVNDKNKTGTTLRDKFDLYRIFNNFRITNNFVCMIYKNPDSKIIKFAKELKENNKNLLKEWFNQDLGVNSLIIKILRDSKKDEDKYLSVTLLENGMLKYRISWEEVDGALIDDIKKSFILINNFIKKVNGENSKIRIIEPDEELYKYIFINSISKINFSKKVKINHNKLSDFARLFYPYLAVEIEPKKRKAKLKDDSSKYSKYGSYFRYKRVRNYNNKNIIERKILYFMKNYSLNDKELITEIANELNITDDYAIKEINNVKQKYSSVINKFSKGKKVLDRIKSNKQGVDIKIQGKDLNSYKLRIDGSRNKEQLFDILKLMNVILYLYVLDATILYSLNKILQVDISSTNILYISL
jgi:hypothetical protein